MQHLGAVAWQAFYRAAATPVGAQGAALNAPCSPRTRLVVSDRPGAAGRTPAGRHRRTAWRLKYDRRGTFSVPILPVVRVASCVHVGCCSMCSSVTLDAWLGSHAGAADGYDGSLPRFVRRVRLSRRGCAHHNAAARSARQDQGIFPRVHLPCICTELFSPSSWNHCRSRTRHVRSRPPQHARARKRSSHPSFKARASFAAEANTNPKKPSTAFKSRVDDDATTEQVPGPGGASGRGLHSSTFQLNLSALYVVGGVARVRGCVARVKGVLGAVEGV